MKKLLFAALMAATSVFSISAEVLSPYVEQFENPTERPKGWLRGGASSYSQGTYKVVETGGHSGGYISVNQYSNYWSSYYNNYGYNDILVTPKVEGEVSIWVRKNGTDPTLTFFTLTDPAAIPSSATDFKLLAGTEKNLLEGKDVSEWTKITVSGVPAGTYLGIRANNLDLDEFTAEKAEVLYRPALIAEVKKDFTGTTFEAGEDGNVTIPFTVTLTNSGDIDFPSSDEGFKIELINVTADNTLFGTGNITDAIPCGAVVSKSFEMTGKPVVAPNTTSNNYSVKISHAKVGEPVATSLGYLTIIPYAPAPKFMFNEANSSNQSNYNDVNILEVINIGAGPVGTSRTLWMWNNGTAALKVSDVKLTGDFSTETKSFSLEKGEKTSITIALTGEPGFKEGKISFTDASLGEIVYNLAGVVTSEGGYYEDFEKGETPEGMILGSGWKVKDVVAALKTLGGEKYIECTQSATYADKFSTPLLQFEKGESLCFMASKSDNTSSKLNVYTSPDRLNWTLVKTISANANDGVETFVSDKPTGTGYGTYEFKNFAIEMPEGQYYVQFEAGAARIDNINGGKKVDVAHDLQIAAINLPEVASVNTRYIPSITLKNLKAQAENDYKVVLEVNGEEVAQAAETPELKLGEAVTYDLRFTPHEEGTFKGEFIFISGDDKVSLYSFEFEVGPEKAEATYQVGTEKIQTTDPLNTYYNCQSQIVYRADQLGMDKGVKITGFSFNGANAKELTKHVKVWIENTEDEGYDLENVVAADNKAMTLVYDGDYKFGVVGSTTASDNNYGPVFVIPFSAPFTYEGKSIRVMIEQTHADNAETHNVFVRVDNSAYNYMQDLYDNRVIENKKDYAEDLDDEPSWYLYKTGFPVTYFTVAKDVVVAKGNVTDDFGAPIENAVVKYTSDDILYQAITDAAGAYSMNIANVGLVYILTAEAEDFDAYSEDNVTFDVVAHPEAVRDIKLNFTDRTATLSGRIISSVTNGAPEAKVEVIMTSGDKSVTAEADADGNYSITVPEFADVYSIEVKIDGETYANIPEYSFASKAETKDINVAWSGVENLDAENYDTVEYYDLNGVRVENPGKGVYIRRQGNTVTKMIKK